MASIRNLIRRKGMPITVEDLPKVLKTWYEDCKHCRTPIVSMGVEARDVLAGAARNEFQFPVPVINYFKSYFDRMLTEFTSSDIEINVAARSNDNQTIPDQTAIDSAVKINRHIRTTLDQSNMKNLCKSLGMDAIIYGNAFIGLEGAYSEEGKEATLKHLYFPDVFMDPMSTNVDLSDSRYFFYRQYVDREQIAQIYKVDIDTLPKPEGYRDGYGVVGMKTTTMISMPVTYITPGTNVASTPEYSYQNNELVDIDLSKNNLTEIYVGWIASKDDESDKWYQIAWHSPESPVVLSYLEYPYPFLPVAHITTTEVPGTPYGYPFWKDIRSTHVWKNWHIARVARKLAYQADPKIMINSAEQGAIDPIIIGNSEPIIWTQHKPEFMEMPPMDNETYLLMDRSTHDLEESIGVNNITLGQGKQVGKQTATEAQILENQSEIRLDAVISSYEQAFEDIGIMLAIQVLQYEGIDVDTTIAWMDFDVALVKRSAFERQREMQLLAATVQTLQGLKMSLTDPTFATLVKQISGMSSLVDKLAPPPPPVPSGTTETTGLTPADIVKVLDPSKMALAPANQVGAIPPLQIPSNQSITPLNQVIPGA